MLLGQGATTKERGVGEVKSFEFSKRKRNIFLRENERFSEVKIKSFLRENHRFSLDRINKQEYNECIRCAEEFASELFLYDSFYNRM